MKNAERILRALDGGLSQPIELTIYGRAALALGFDAPPSGSEKTLDVDAIIPLAQLEAITQNEEFWQSIERVNKELTPEGLYLTHLFQEDQVILTPDWMNKRVKIVEPAFIKLELYRPSTIDLVLTKMMRGGDPEDMSDIRFLIDAGKITPAQLEKAFASAVVPPITEIEKGFRDVQPKVQEIAARRLANLTA
jgi:hypothetical protein